MLSSSWSLRLREVTLSTSSSFSSRFLSSSLPLERQKKLWRRGEIFLPVEKKSPSSAVISNSLLVKGGFIRQLGQGVHSMLPYGHKVMNRLRSIIEEELEAVGGQQVSLPLLHPRSLWDKTNRWEAAGQELFTLTDRHDTEHCLAPTHEEVVTSVVATNPPKRANLPILLFQIGTKFRDEIRPRFGVARGKEFEMLDLYSFDESGERTTESYNLVSGAFREIFRRMGLNIVVADAQSGNISDKPSQEFHVLSPTMGEDDIVFCPACKCTANLEKAEGRYLYNGYKISAELEEQLSKEGGEQKEKELERLLEEGLNGGLEVSIIKGIEREVEEEDNNTTDNNNNIAIVVLPKGRAPNLDKILGLSGWTPSPPPSPSPFVLFTASSPSDKEKFISKMRENFTSSFPPFFIDGGVVEGEGGKDIGTAQEGDKCGAPHCEGITISKGIEVGHIFHLGTKYSSVLGATVKGPDNVSRPMDMGCFGIGVSRLMAAIVELNHDEKGMKWPFEVAPFKAVVVTVGKEEGVYKGAEQVAKSLMSIPELEESVLLDDRKESPGFKFTESELIGYPFVVVVGKSFQKTGEVEVWERRTGDKTHVLPENLSEFISQKIATME